MSTKPYVSAPDVFLLQLPVGAPNIATQPFESGWGTTDEKLCFYNGVLIGLVHEQASGQYGLVSLLPKLDHRRGYPWPSLEAFSHALAACLQTSPTWELRCERDADQHPVKVLSNPTEIRAAIQAALTYSQGESATCPTFIARCVA